MDNEENDVVKKRWDEFKDRIADEGEVDEDSDHPIHEKYTKEGKRKK
jgi:hypothetical protein